MIRTRSTLLIAIAFLVLTAGTATAATKVLIKSSAQVKNGSLDAADLSAKARKSLRGKTGPAGPAGAPGTPGAPGPAGARGPSEALSSISSAINAPLCPAGGCEAGAVLRTLTVPAGSYLFTASAEIAPAVFVANATRSFECHLARGDDDVFQRTLRGHTSGAAVATEDETMEVTWALTLPATTTMSLSCYVGNAKFTAANARITALQVGTLTETVN